MLKYETLREGDQVAVSRVGSWTINNEGIYTVSKANKVKVVLTRTSDGYTREFSIKRRVELGRTETHRSSAFIESLDDFSKRNEFYKKERELAQTWKSAEDAARTKDLTVLKELVAKLENM